MTDDEYLDLPATVPAPGFAPVVINWRTLAEDESNAVWVELNDWVEWARHRYQLAALKPCWWRHADVVEQLSALQTAWKVCFDPEDSGMGPVTFLDHLDRVNPRLKTALQGCTREHSTVEAVKRWTPQTDAPWAARGKG
jgi:hypothetical protein